MTPEQLNVSDYGRFRNYLQHLRSADYPLGRFLTLLLELPRSVARSHLLAASYDESFEIRCEVLPIAARLVPLEAGVRSIELLSDPDAPVRIVALNAITYLELPAEVSVLRLLAAETDGDARYVAVATLEVIGTARCLASLASIAESDSTSNYEGRSVAARAEAAALTIRQRHGIAS